MAKPQGKVKIEWSPEFAYAMGLLATDGCLFGGRCIDLTSKDKEQLLNFLTALKINVKIGLKSRGGKNDKKYFRVQFGDILFYKFLISIGITPAKSKTMEEIKIPNIYFFDFVRGCFDGDGCFYSYCDPRWKSSFMYYVVFASASKKYIRWMQGRLKIILGIKGHITSAKGKSCEQLKYAKKESLQLLHAIYYKKGVICLSRKRLKIKLALGILGERL